LVEPPVLVHRLLEQPHASCQAAALVHESTCAVLEAHRQVTSHRIFSVTSPDAVRRSTIVPPATAISRRRVAGSRVRSPMVVLPSVRNSTRVLPPERP